MRVAHDVELAVGVDAERADVPELRASAERGSVLEEVRCARLAGDGSIVSAERPHAALDEIGEEIAASMRRTECAAAVHVAAGDRAGRCCGRIRESDRRAGEMPAGASVTLSCAPSRLRQP